MPELPDDRDGVDGVLPGTVPAVRAAPARQIGGQRRPEDGMTGRRRRQEERMRILTRVRIPQDSRSIDCRQREKESCGNSAALRVEVSREKVPNFNYLNFLV